MWTAVFMALAVMGYGFGKKEAGIAAARFVAGEGMLRLTRAKADVQDPAETQRNGRKQHGEEQGGCSQTAPGEEGSQMEHPRVALTFDDGPNRKYTPLLLDGLKERGIHATFFLMGKNIEGNEELVSRIQEEGHLIGNHTYSHVQLNRVSSCKAKEEIEKTSNAIYQVTGVYPTYIRPPFGSWRKNLELSVTMLPVFWDVDTLDWKSRNVTSILKIVKNQTADGDIILMHDSYGTSVEAALAIVDLLIKEGYDFVTVEELLVT